MVLRTWCYMKATRWAKYIISGRSRRDIHHLHIDVFDSRGKAKGNGLGAAWLHYRIYRDI